MSNPTLQELREIADRLKVYAANLPKGSFGALGIAYPDPDYHLALATLETDLTVVLSRLERASEIERAAIRVRARCQSMRFDVDAAAALDDLSQALSAKE